MMNMGTHLDEAGVDEMMRDSKPDKNGDFDIQTFAKYCFAKL
jgi:Ca2+-binding EF-hand superfamily protein